MQELPEGGNGEKGIPELIRRRDQALLAWLVLVAGAGVFMGESPMSGASQRSLEWEGLPQREAQFRVNVNEASWPEMTQLPEIGETLSRRIVENRRREGPFHTADDLTRVHGIGKKTLGSMRPYLGPDYWTSADRAEAVDVP